MPEVTSIYFQGKTLKSVKIKGQQYWPMRDLGKVLGYGSKGGNLSRQVNNGFCGKLREDEDFIFRKRPGKGGQPLILLTNRGVGRTLRMVAKHDDKRSATALVFLKTYWQPPTRKGPTLKQQLVALEARVAFLEQLLRSALLPKAKVPKTPLYQQIDPQ